MSTKPERPVPNRPLLTLDQQHQKEIISGLYDVQRKAAAALEDATSECVHVFGPNSKSKYEWNSCTKQWEACFSVYCYICSISGGWYCPESPNNACDYNTDDDPMCDSCLYCGQPEERK